jgi:hypothetical protein
LQPCLINHHEAGGFIDKLHLHALQEEDHAPCREGCLVNTRLPLCLVCLENVANESQLLCRSHHHYDHHSHDHNHHSHHPHPKIMITTTIIINTTNNTCCRIGLRETAAGYGPPSCSDSSAEPTFGSHSRSGPRRKDASLCEPPLPGCIIVSHVTRHTSHVTRHSHMSNVTRVELLT